MGLRDSFGIAGGLCTENFKYFEELNVGWYKWTPTKDDPAFEKICTDISLLLKKLNMKWLFTLHPSYKDPRVEWNEWKDFIHYVYNKYRDVIGAFLVVNEPNCGLFWPPCNKMMNYYAELLKRSYETIKKICNLRVLFGSLAGGNFDYYFKVKERHRDIDLYFDCFALNLCPGYPPELLHTVLKQVSKPVWITETNRCVSEERKSFNSKTLGDIVSEDPYENYLNLKKIIQISFEEGVEKIFFYTIRDGTGDYFADHCGLVSADGKRRPSFYLVKSLCSGYEIPETDTIYLLDYAKRKVIGKIRRTTQFSQSILNTQLDYWILKDYLV